MNLLSGVGAEYSRHMNPSLWVCIARNLHVKYVTRCSNAIVCIASVMQHETVAIHYPI